MELQLIDGISVAHVVLQAETSLSSSGRTQSGCSKGVAALYLDALHADVVDDANDAPGASHGQQRVAGVGVVRPRARVEVLICLSTSGQVKPASPTFATSGFELNAGRKFAQLQLSLQLIALKPHQETQLLEEPSRKDRLPDII